MVLLNDFSFLKINRFEKPKCWKDVDKPGPSAVIHDSGVGNKRPMLCACVCVCVCVYIY